jgi:hypothetical protein
MQTEWQQTQNQLAGNTILKAEVRCGPHGNAQVRNVRYETPWGCLIIQDLTTKVIDITRVVEP